RANRPNVSPMTVSAKDRMGDPRRGEGRSPTRVQTPRSGRRWMGRPRDGEPGSGRDERSRVFDRRLARAQSERRPGCHVLAYRRDMSESAAGAATAVTAQTPDFSDHTDADLLEGMALAGTSVAKAHAAFAEVHRRLAAYLYAACDRRLLAL